jgi:hypothetical protein
MLDLLDYRRRVSGMYAAVRAARGDPAAWLRWRQARDDLFRNHPSCAYHPRWVCPLAPPENQLEFPIPAGEKLTSTII